jgi:hypothetical protein
MTDAGERVSGNVRRVTIDGGQPRLDIALPNDIRAGSEAGDIESGTYTYEFVWTGDQGQTFSTEYTVDTANVAGFNGSLQIGNLPVTNTPKQVYRTDRTGQGDRVFVGSLSSGQQTTFTDSLADNARVGTTLNFDRQRLTLQPKVTVSLNNVAQIEPPR